MGQSVRSMAKVGDAIEADKNGHKKDQDGDVTQFLFGQNSDNSNTAVPLPSDEPSMSSIVDTQANNIPTDNTANDLAFKRSLTHPSLNLLGSGDASARLFTKRPWIGCQPLPVSDSRSQFTTSSTSIVTAVTAVTTTMVKGGEGGAKVGSNSRGRSALSKARLRKPSSSILNDISFGSLLVDRKNSSFKDIQEQQGIQKFISLVANSSSHAKTQSDDKTTAALRATTTNSPEMEQLITMMKNHKVSEESEERISNTRSNTVNTKENGLQIDQSDPKYAYLKSRKILPLPKPRLKKSALDSNNVHMAPSSNDNSGSLFKDVYNTTEQNDRENSKKMRHSISPSTSSSSSNQVPQYHNILSNTSPFDFSIDKLKQLPLQHQQRQALDPITIKLDLDKAKQTVNVSAKSKENKTNQSTSKVASSDTKPATNTNNKQQPKKSPNAKKKKKGKVAVQSPPPLVSAIQHEQPSSRKGGNNKKGQRNQQKKKWDDDFSTAPGGFLSSDITLFENPLSDDWICLFCQYEVLCYGLEVTKRKNGYYRRKREKLQREASRRLMHHEPSDSDDELVFKDERHIRAS